MAKNSDTRFKESQILISDQSLERDALEEIGYSQGFKTNDLQPTFNSVENNIAGIASVDGVGRPQLNLIDSFEKKRSDQLTAISSRPQNENIDNGSAVITRDQVIGNKAVSKVPIHQGEVVNQHADSGTTIALTNKLNLMEAQSRKTKVRNEEKQQDNKKVEKMRDDAKDPKSQTEKQIEETQSKRKKDDFEAKLEEKFYGVFWLGEKKHLFSVTSCNCMGQHNSLRKASVALICNVWFDRFITFCILINSCLLASKEYDNNYNANYVSIWNEFLDTVDLVFSVIFTIECILKIIAMGFVRHKKAYLREAWNCIDFFIVLSSLVTLTPLSSDSSLKVFRTARVLRPLRSMHQLKSMRSLLTTFFSSIPGLLNVCLFQSFIFTIFAIIGVNIFVGKHYQFCRETEEILSNDKWPKSQDPWQCSSDDMCRGSPSEIDGSTTKKCGDVFADYDLDPVIYDGAYEEAMINYDITNFNNVLSASVTIFQVITLEGWTQLMYNYMDTTGTTQASIFFVMVVIIGAFVSLNLVLASIMDNYFKQSLEQEEAKKRELDQIKKEQKRLQEQQEHRDKEQALSLASDSNDPDNESSAIVIQDKSKGYSHKPITDKQLQIQKVQKPSSTSFELQMNRTDDKTDFYPNNSIGKHLKDQGASSQEVLANIDSSSALPAINNQDLSRINAIMQIQKREQQANQLIENGSSELQMDASFYKSSTKKTNEMASMEMQTFQVKKLKYEHIQQDPVIVQHPANDQSHQSNTLAQKIGNDIEILEEPELDVIRQEKIGIESVTDIGKLSAVKDGEQHFVKMQTDSHTALQQILEEEEEQDLIAETRSNKNGCFRFFYRLVTSVTFNFLIYCFILANTITLALYRYDQSDQQEKILAYCDIIFVWVFTAELLTKLIGLGLKVYILDKFNAFDAVIVVISLIDFTLSMTIDMESAAGIMSAMRALRLLRVVKLARHWQAFQQILQALVAAMVDISSFSVLLILFLFIFALLGMEIFAFSVYIDTEGEAVFGQENIQAAFERGDTLTWPRVNFNNVFNSLLTVFIVVVAEDWNQVMYLYVRALSYDAGIGRSLSIIYFLCLFILGNTIMLALFTALLLKSQDKDFEALTEKFAEKETEKLSKTLSSKDLTLQHEVNANPFKSMKNKCSRKACVNSYSSIADSFVKIFGGETALRQREKLSKDNKDPFDIGTSKHRGAILPADDNKDVFELNSDINTEDQKYNKKDNDGRKKVDISHFVQADAIKDANPNPLQRPVALLHYDCNQVIQVSLRSKTRQEVRTRKGRSLFIFGPNNPIRKFCDIVSSHRVFEYVIILCILVSTITLAFEHPMEDPKSDLMDKLTKIDYVFTAIFCLEAIMKIITFGFIVNFKDSYLLSSWNILDFSIVVLSVVSLLVDAKLQVVKVLRTARIMRPLRLIQHADGLKIAIQALFKAIPQIMRLQFVVFFFMFMISILLTSLLSGKMFRCDLSHTDLSFSQQQKLITNKWNCINYGGIWRDADLNFDNTLSGMMSLFVFQTLEGWTVLMYDSVDATEVNYLGVRDTNSLYIFFYLILVIVLALLFTNMFVSIVIGTYNMEKDFLSFNLLLTEEQRSWIQVQIMTYKAKPITLLNTHSSSFIRNTAIKISLSRVFDNTIIACIILNTLVMALTWFDEPKQLSEVTEVLNIIFMVIFTLEAIVKIIAFKKLYFKDAWNIFDFTIVVSTIMMLLLTAANVPVPFGNGPMILRALRIGRIFRLIKQARQLQIIFNTLVDSAASQGSLGLLLVMSFFMFAIIGRSLFGLVKIGGPNVELNEHANFRDFGTSFLLLLRCSTGENWHLIMLEIARTYAPDYQCREDEDYDSMMANGGEPFACGSPITSYTFFVLFNIFVFQIYINLFVAIMIDAFLGQSNQMSLPVNEDMIQEFIQIWSRYDPEATGYMLISDLDEFIEKLAKSNEARGLVILHEQIASDATMRRRFLSYLNIPTYQQLTKVMFYDVLQQLCYRVNLVLNNKDALQDKKIEQMGLQAFGKNKGKDQLSLIIEQQKENAGPFIKSVRNMGRLNHKIKLMVQLQKMFKDVHEKYALYADTVTTITWDDFKRRSMKNSELQKVMMQGQMSVDDMNVYTTKHTMYGTVILNALKNLQQRRLRRSTMSNRSSPMRSQTRQRIDTEQERSERGSMVRNSVRSSHTPTKSITDYPSQRLQSTSQLAAGEITLVPAFGGVVIDHPRDNNISRDQLLQNNTERVGQSKTEQAQSSLKDSSRMIDGRIDSRRIISDNDKQDNLDADEQGEDDYAIDI